MARGTGFSAVVTTGIYCRPGCAARPLPDHVRPYPFAAAAEASGFRACLRCRPYRASDPPRWLAGPELVCRAVHLVLEGALDGAGEAALAARLGVSARHLRRLFAAHVGATPDQLARSRRAHFARRLLDDTDLPVAQVAYAAGFGSVRQLNRVVAAVFGAAPGELRARRRRADRLAADGGLVLRVPYEPPLDWKALLGFLGPRAVPGVETVDGDTYRRTVLVDGDPGVLELSPGEEGHLLLRAHLPHLHGLIHVVQRVRRMCDLDGDLAAAQARLRDDPALAPLLDARPGLRVPGTWDPFECGVRAILGQQVSVAGATTLAGRVVERAGTPVAGLAPLGLTHVFPSPDALAGADLDGLGLPAVRARAVRAFACAVAAGDVALDRASGLTRLVDELTALPGVGPWTAQYLAMRSGERDAFPHSDLWIRRALARLDGEGVPSAAAARDRSEAWRPWRSYAAMHLWASVTG